MTTSNPLPSGTIDITNLVEQLRGSFVTWGVKFIVAVVTATPWLTWLNLPVIQPLFVLIVRELLDVLSKALEMQGFFMNTAIRKSGQASDFVNAVNAKNELPVTATQKEIELAEEKQMQAFRNFVMVTN